MTEEFQLLTASSSLASRISAQVSSGATGPDEKYPITGFTHLFALNSDEVSKLPQT